MNEEQSLLYDVIQHFGCAHQMMKAIEEMDELSVELARWQDSRTTEERIEEECADVMIMAEQIALMFHYENVMKWKERKLQRLKKMIENEK